MLILTVRGDAFGLPSNAEACPHPWSAKTMANSPLGTTWSSPRKRTGKWIRASFFEKEISNLSELTFKKNEEINFIRIEKKGYHWAEIKIPKNPSKDYKVLVTLNLKAEITSRFYISNTKINCYFKSDCEILFNKLILKEQDCL